ncbi:MAG: hypothetical protein AAGA56_04050 [Myxococcota bacterium]
MQRDALPSLGTILKSFIEDFDAEGYDEERAGRYARRERFY